MRLIVSSLPVEDVIGPLGAPFSSNHGLTLAETVPMVDIKRSTTKILNTLLDRGSVVVTLTDSGSNVCFVHTIFMFIR